MSIMEEIADGLAQKALKIAIEEDDDKIVTLMADAIANSSPTLEEAFLTAVRFRRGEFRALEVLGRYKPKPAATDAPDGD
jgi:hypothetical protein